MLKMWGSPISGNTSKSDTEAPRDVLDELFAPAVETIITSSNNLDNRGRASPLENNDNILPLISNKNLQPLCLESNEILVIDSVQADERRVLLERLLNDDIPRWYEACIILQSICSFLEYKKAQQWLISHSKDLNSEESLVQKNLIDECYQYFVSTIPFVEFLQTFKHISVFPILKVIPITITLHEYIQEWIESHNGLNIILSELNLVKEFQKLLQVVNEVFSNIALTSAHSPSEALLLSSLTDICRYCIQILSTSVPHKDYPFSGNTMHSIMDHNCSIISHIDEELYNHRSILQLLIIARSTAYHRCSEDVQASVSPLIAELLSIFDSFSSNSIIALDKRTMIGKRCKLSGILLQQDEENGEMDTFVNKYWNMIMEN